MTKTVLITGSSTGLGNTAAKKFANEGWNVVATMRKPDRRLAEENPDRIFVTELDVTKPATIEAAIAAGIARFGRIDAVVNNAGVSILSIFEATPMNVIRGIFETNVFGVMNVIQAITPYFREQGGGTIVNVTSNVGFVSNPLLTVYVATKHAVEGLSESLSYELESQNISVKLVEPGAMRTTNFASNTMAAAQDVSIPQAYKSYFDHMMNSMMNYPFDSADENQVADQVYAAACDPSNRLRYLAGPDAEETAKLRWSQSEEKYMATMRDLLGQTAWRNSQG
ncbi:SDR family NAD(P)-dependent oxidoreductase [Paenibacillus macerans]|uniref:SDR family NAD(P)-dependent oxidoreductase n=2 Tax=Paenibacillus TaxID=44249 RepID=A0A090Z6E2_PAEMA|nr:MULTISPECIES: SDR family oxidoreductase [Paenibacillus]KFN05918.1 short chain dehydrogenase family protein [Paenibacillus macerans]MCY7559902.1 SDR family oxidoreductase [Paenibacillus macerans]MEC0151459.1 SDR family oxidoreductase [Paenibacillus macerans]MUG24874.1 SDR family NAD(P)-dependent oxidoreductase [Paenibacillus macerans]RRJ63966.1 SDR family oxidoreductase [Paenibacillus oralis]